MDSDEFQGLFKKYSPLIISIIGIIFLLILGEIRRAWLLLIVGLAMQYFWMRFRYPKSNKRKIAKSKNSLKKILLL